MTDITIKPETLALLRRAQGDLHNAIAVIDRLSAITLESDANWHINKAEEYANSALMSIKLCMKLP